MKTVVQKIKSHLEWCFKQEDPLYHVSALLTALDQNVVEKGESYLDQEKQQMIDFAKEALKNASENAKLTITEFSKRKDGSIGWDDVTLKDNLYIINDGCNIVADKQSILNESNIPNI